MRRFTVSHRGQPMFRYRRTYSSLPNRRFGSMLCHRLQFDDIAEAFRISADKTRGAIKVHVVQE